MTFVDCLVFHVAVMAAEHVDLKVKWWTFKFNRITKKLRVTLIVFSVIWVRIYVLFLERVVGLLISLLRTSLSLISVLSLLWWSAPIVISIIVRRCIRFSVDIFMLIFIYRVSPCVCCCCITHLAFFGRSDVFRGVFIICCGSLGRILCYIWCLRSFSPWVGGTDLDLLIFFVIVIIFIVVPCQCHRLLWCCHFSTKLCLVFIIFLARQNKVWSLLIKILSLFKNHAETGFWGFGVLGFWG